MKEYLQDIDFLTALDEMRIKEQYIKLIVLDFNENPIREIQGIATAGTISVNGASAVRRTISLTMVASKEENDLSNIDNLISANKKIKVEKGLKNPFSTYVHYGDIIWFPLGTYLISEVNSSTTATLSTISLKGKDKMCMLDGTCGGVLPATVNFHEVQIENENGEVTIEHPTIYRIIKECVRHYGGEIEQNIIINDLNETAKQSIKYNGSSPIWFKDDYSHFIISEYAPDPEQYPEYLAHKFVYGQEIGYMETDFTYPGELVLEAGKPVTEVLDKIISVIGNYEYFYDLEGKFVFQEKKNYLNNYYTPVINLTDEYYIKAFTDTKYYKTLNNAKDAISYHNSPKYENIKNDFVVWGFKTSSDGVTRSVKYHLAIDEKPLPDLALQYMWDVQNGFGEHLYYLFDFEDKGYDKQNVPTPEPIDVYLNVEESNIIASLEEYLNDNGYIKYSSKESSFVVYLRVFWNKEIRYYKAKISNQELKFIEYKEELTDSIEDKKIILGIYVPLEKENQESQGGNNYLPTPDGGGKIEGSEAEDVGRTYNLSRKDDSQEENPPKENEEKDYAFMPLVIEKRKNESDKEIKQLGFYDENKKWNYVWSIDSDYITLKDFKDNILKNISLKYVSNVRIFVNEDFQDLDHEFDDIFTYNTLSKYSKANPKLLKNYNNDTCATFKYTFNSLSGNKEFISADTRKKLITYLAPRYKKNFTKLVQDLETIYKLEIDTEKEGWVNILPWTSSFTPTIEGSDVEDVGDGAAVEIINGLKKEEEIKENEVSGFNFLTEEYADIILRYYLIGKEVSDLVEEIEDYLYSIILEKNSFNDVSLTIVTHYPDTNVKLDYEDNYWYTLLARPLNEKNYDWREELYRQALLNKETAGEAGYYDEELLAFWRQNFDTMNEDWKKQWEEQIGSDWCGWNPCIYIDPGLLFFWLDFIDSNQIISQYSVNKIGRRSKVISKDRLSLLYRLEVPDVIFFENKSGTEQEILETELKIQDYKNLNQAYCALKPSEMKYFSSSGVGSTAFDYIREMLYTYLCYNVSININCIPKYYLEPNNIIYVSDSNSNIYGDFIISSYNLPLAYGGNMTITANEILVRV